jgi:hypothetical protein
MPLTGDDNNRVTHINDTVIANHNNNNNGRHGLQMYIDEIKGAINRECNQQHKIVRLIGSKAFIKVVYYIVLTPIIVQIHVC